MDRGGGERDKAAGGSGGGDVCVRKTAFNDDNNITIAIKYYVRKQLDRDNITNVRLFAFAPHQPETNGYRSIWVKTRPATIS